tara:strand:+ start:373 stop:684 length:312 start_codon:yes stop_codon:yes gene_type:complete
LGGAIAASSARATDAGASVARDAAPSNARRRDTDDVDDSVRVSSSLSFPSDADADALGRMDRALRSSRALDADRGVAMRAVGTGLASDDMRLDAFPRTGSATF